MNQEPISPTNTTSKSSVSTSNVIIISAIVFLVGFVIGTRRNEISSYIGISDSSQESLDLSSVNDVYKSLRANFDGDLIKADLINGAKRGLVAAAGDRYTVFMDEEEAAEFRRDLEGDVGAGIGVEVGERNGVIVVVRTLRDNPAVQAGVKAGDIFYRVNDEDVSQLTSEEVANRVRGVAGTSVKVTFIRDGEEVEFNITREKINNPSVELEYEGDIAIMRIFRFDTDTGSLAQKAAKELNEKGINKVILDLRANGGGFVTSAQDVLSLWLDRQTILFERSVRGFSDELKSFSGRAILSGKQTAVLVDGFSASASEIVAGALSDHGQATLIGETTFGKGSVQSVIDLDKSILKVTIARWYTPNNLNITESGITPDIEVKLTLDDINNNNDKQLHAALDFLRR